MFICWPCTVVDDAVKGVPVTVPVVAEPAGRGGPVVAEMVPLGNDRLALHGRLRNHWNRYGHSLTVPVVAEPAVKGEPVVAEMVPLAKRPHSVTASVPV